MPTIGDVIPFEQVSPQYAKDEFDFALDDWEASHAANEGWKRGEIPIVTIIDGSGYACPPANLLGEHNYTYHARVDTECFVWCWPIEQWLIVGEDI